MSKTEKNIIPEVHLHEIWQKQKFSNDLKTVSGENVIILETGEHNTDTNGPDFKHCRLRIGNLTFVGDIEIDREYTDWKNHGHHLDANYNSVILHLSLFNKLNQQYVYSKQGRKIPDVRLTDFIADETLREFAAKKPVKEKSIFLKCSSHISKVETQTKLQFVKELGFARFNKKAERIKSRLKEISYIKQLSVSEPVINYDLPKEFFEKEFSIDDFKARSYWQQTFYEFLFESLGYSKNKSIMRDLAKTVEIDFISKININENHHQTYEAVFYNIAGLIPDVENLPPAETSEYSKELCKIWSDIKSNYDSVTYSETDWHFFKLRPHNFPTIRIAGGARILNAVLNKNLIGIMIDYVKKNKNENKILNYFRSLFTVKADGFWKSHFVFDKEAKSGIKYFVGVSRADEIIVNVALPFLYTFFDIFEDKEIRDRVVELYYLSSQHAQNRITTDVAESLDIKSSSSRTIFAQGMIELFRNYCSKDKCSECKIGKAAFK